MRKLLKWVIYLLLAVMSVLAVGFLGVNIYKKEILSAINEKLKETVNGDVNIGDYNVTFLHRFPHLSITLTDIYLHGPKYELFNRPFLKAERVDVNLAAFKLLIKEISIQSVDVEHGELFVFRTIEGYTNAEVFKTRKVVAGGSADRLAVIDLKQINLLDVTTTYQDSLKKKSIGIHFINTENILSEIANGTSVRVLGNMTFEGLLLNASKGKFLKHKNALADLTIELDSTRKSLILKPSKLIFDQSSITLDGEFKLNKSGIFQLNVGSEQMDYKEALTILPDTTAKKLGRFFVEKPIRLKVNIKGVLEPGIKPSVDVAFSFKDSQASAGKVIMEGADIEGTFMNHNNPQLPNDDSNSRLEFSKLKGKINNLPVEAKATLIDMHDPSIHLQASFNVALKDLNPNFDSTTLKLLDGQFKSNFTYSGKLNEYLDETRTSYEGKLSGEATVSNGSLNYNRKRIRISNVNAVFGFNEKQFDIKKLGLQLNKNDINVVGSMMDFIPFFINPKNTGKLKLAIWSPRLDISGMLQQRKTLTSKSKQAASKQKMADMFNRINKELEFDIDFDIKEFINANFKASKAKGKLVLANNQFVIRNASMNFANGKVALNMRVDDLQREISPLQLDAKINDVSLKQFFFCFNDFNQSTFSHKHIDGKLNFDINLQAEVNDKFEFLIPNLKGNMRFSIQDGRLKNFEPMQRLSNFLLKGRDFSDVQFGEISTEVAMNGTLMDVSRMEIESTVLTMFIEGKYDLGDNSDLSIQVPLSNLKKRDQGIAPENIGVDAKVGASVFLRVRPDKNGKTAISYDPFKKLRKKKKGERPA